MKPTTPVQALLAWADLEGGSLHAEHSLCPAMKWNSSEGRRTLGDKVKVTILGFFGDYLVQSNLVIILEKSYTLSSLKYSGSFILF